ncbi:MAG: hypothetical protein DME24_04915 [Verrucomicrobia bacterium]|nr:MAG: hypothetical protein DME24_04915 [Verrucomicrobiota bacterium]
MPTPPECQSKIRKSRSDQRRLHGCFSDAKRCRRNLQVACALLGWRRTQITHRPRIDFLQGVVGRLAHSFIGVPKGTLQSGDGFRGRCRDLSDETIGAGTTSSERVFLVNNL